MRKLLLALFILSGWTALQAQSHKEEITEDINIYFQTTEDKDWNALMDLIYPKLFDMVPKDQMVAVFDQMEAEGMSISIGNMDVKSISGMEFFGDEKIALVDYAAEMSINFTGDTYTQPETLQMMKGSFEATYGEENVTFDEENTSFDVKMEKAMFAIADKDSTDWKFLENNEGMETLMGQLIPKEVRDKFSN